MAKISSLLHQRLKVLFPLFTSNFLLSKMIRCAVIDDEPWAIALLTDYIKKTDFLELVFSTANAIEALQKIQQQPVDLVFLDIQMPELTGIQFMKINGNRSRVILTTAYSEYALDGYEHNVIDYLLKPVSFDRFYTAALKAKQTIDTSTCYFSSTRANSECRCRS